MSYRPARDVHCGQEPRARCQRYWTRVVEDGDQFVRSAGIGADQVVTRQGRQRQSFAHHQCHIAPPETFTADRNHVPGVKGIGLELLKMVINSSVVPELVLIKS